MYGKSLYIKILNADCLHKVKKIIEQQRSQNLSTTAMLILAELVLTRTLDYKINRRHRWNYLFAIL